jgi:hypothetical protein
MRVVAGFDVVVERDRRRQRCAPFSVYYLGVFADRNSRRRLLLHPRSRRQLFPPQRPVCEARMSEQLIALDQPGCGDFNRVLRRVLQEVWTPLPDRLSEPVHQRRRVP